MIVNNHCAIFCQTVVVTWFLSCGCCVVLVYMQQWHGSHQHGLLHQELPAREVWTVEGWPWCGDTSWGWPKEALPCQLRDQKYSSYWAPVQTSNQQPSKVSPTRSLALLGFSLVWSYSKQSLFDIWKCRSKKFCFCICKKYKVLYMYQRIQVCRYICSLILSVCCSLK